MSEGPILVFAVHRRDQAARLLISFLLLAIHAWLVPSMLADVFVFYFMGMNSAFSLLLNLTAAFAMFAASCVILLDAYYLLFLNVRIIVTSSGITRRVGGRDEHFPWGALTAICPSIECIVTSDGKRHFLPRLLGPTVGKGGWFEISRTLGNEALESRISAHFEAVDRFVNRSSRKTAVVVVAVLAIFLFVLTPCSSAIMYISRVFLLSVALLCLREVYFLFKCFISSVSTAQDIGAIERSE